MKTSNAVMEFCWAVYGDLADDSFDQCLQVEGYYELKRKEEEREKYHKKDDEEFTNISTWGQA